MLVSGAISLMSLIAKSQVKIGNNPTNVNPNSLLELESTTKGLLLPRLTNAQIQAMNNVPPGMLVFSSTDSALYLRKDTSWAILAFRSNIQKDTTWQSKGNDIYNTNSGKVGIGTTTPYSQLSNTADNILGSDGYGGNDGSFAWAADQVGYAGMLYNASEGYAANGLAVKVASSDANALDVSKAEEDGSATSLLTVKSYGKVGIGNHDPSEALDVNGTVKATKFSGSGSSLTDLDVLQVNGAISANNPSFTGKVGIGTTTPYSQLSNTADNVLGSDGNGGNPGSFAWAANQDGYAGMIYNGGGSGSSDGLAVKVASTNATALDVSRGQQTGRATSLLTVKSNGDINYSGTLNIGVQYISKTHTTPGENRTRLYAFCPLGTQVIGGGGGYNGSFDQDLEDIVVDYSGPYQSSVSAGWQIDLQNNDTRSRPVIIYAICAKVK